MLEVSVQKVEIRDDRFESLKKSLRNRICREALKTALLDLKNKVKANAPKKTGALKMSIGIKVGTSKQTTWGRVGPRMGYSKFKKGKLHLPWRYVGPLVRGHGKTLGNNFNLVSFRKDTIIEKMTTSIGKQIDRHLQKTANVPF